jgi:soluble lytic murein transglycosylase
MSKHERTTTPVWALACLLVCLLAAAGSVGADGSPLSISAAATLRAARLAEERGEHPLARRLLAKAARENPSLADVADLLSARIAFVSDPAASLAEIVAVRSRHPQSPLAPDLAELEGEAQLAAGHEASARAALEAARAKSRPREREARLLGQIAASYDRSGDHSAARSLYLQLWTRHPQQPAGAEADTWLRADEARGGPLRTPAIWQRRGNRLLDLRDNDAAIRAYDRALEDYESETARKRVRHLRAEALFRARRYTESEAAFAALPQRGDVPVWRARAMARSGRVEEAIRRLIALADGPGRLKGRHNARQIAALLLVGEGRGKEARPFFEDLAGVRHRPFLQRDALWQLGWEAYREGHFEIARSYFADLEKSERSEIAKLRPRYWGARSFERLGATDAAEARYRELARDHPLSYYGWRAAQRIGGAPARGAGPRDQSLEHSSQNAAPSSDFERARILLAAGLREPARQELRSLSKKLRTPEDLARLAGLYTANGDRNAAQLLAIRIGTEKLARGPQHQREALWWYAWPRAHADFVDRAIAAAGGDVSPALVRAIVREESSFRPRVVSVVGARGLMQILDETGRGLAKRGGEETYDAEDLFNPETNIRLGTRYLAELREEFPERPAAAIASYNAGPRVVRKWTTADPDLEEDEWVESIPYNQTRNYVRRVQRSVHVYASLYGDD